LVLGDFGIVYIPESRERLTLTNERVGPRDYMPQWGDLGERLEKVHPNFDVYMLGKLLWCMVTGKFKLPREYHDRPGYNITKLFPDEQDMAAVDAIVKKCVTEEPDQCLASAGDLLSLVDERLTVIEEGGEVVNDGGSRRCRICARGRYRKEELDAGVTGRPVISLSLAGKPIEVSIYICDCCGNVQFFRDDKGLVAKA
jgi:hypothetical protein